MRSALFSIILVAMVAHAMAIPAGMSRLTVVMDFKGPWSASAAHEMQKESARILNPAGLTLEWKMRGEALSGGANSGVFVMTFHGSCQFDPQPRVYDELGPYASTHETNGEVQPFGDVDCSRIVSSARYAMSNSDFERQDYLVGRALGRVVAHELVHMVTRSEDHAHGGVQKAGLSGRELIGAPLPLEASDVSRIRLAIAAAPFQK